MGIWRRIGNALRNEEDSYLIGDTVEIIRKQVSPVPTSVQKRRWERLCGLLEKHYGGEVLSGKDLSAINFLCVALQNEFRTLSTKRRNMSAHDKGRFFDRGIDLDKLV